MYRLQKATSTIRLLQKILNKLDSYIISNNKLPKEISEFFDNFLETLIIKLLSTKDDILIELGNNVKEILKEENWIN